jgi:hypothetical protein
MYAKSQAMKNGSNTSCKYLSVSNINMVMTVPIVSRTTLSNVNGLENLEFICKIIFNLPAFQKTF